LPLLVILDKYYPYSLKFNKGFVPVNSVPSLQQRRSYHTVDTRLLFMKNKNHVEAVSLRSAKKSNFRKKSLGVSKIFSVLEPQNLMLLRFKSILSKQSDAVFSQKEFRLSKTVCLSNSKYLDNVHPDSNKSECVYSYLEFNRNDMSKKPFIQNRYTYSRLFRSS
jgi:hypothetical protein